MHRHPTQGVKGAKPRFPETDGKTSKSELQKLSCEYLKIRNRQMHAKAFMAETAAAARRGELIEKSLVEKQAAYLLVALRQKILNVPATEARKILNIADPRQARAVLREMMIGLLGELRDLPSKVTNPHWLDELEEKDA